MKRIFSGVQPTGNLHLGNYLGAIRNFARLQNDYECIYCMVDMHAITIWQDPKELRHNTREVAAGMIAAGVDPANNILFNQSQVSAHAELAWIFNCVARLGWLDRMTQFKEKSGKHKQRASLGLYGYPVLQAADVLVYQATHVPVGEDQKQHLELARDIASKFNSDTGTETFVLPEPFIGKSAARIMSLRDGNAKMSKSDPSDLSRINMSDDDDTIARKLKKAKTDPEPLPDNLADLAERPEARNLVGIYAALADQSQEDVLADYAGKGFGDFKPALADLAVSTLSPIRHRFEELRKDTAAIDAILRDGSEKASALARPTVEAAYAALGLLRN